jgi:hypothetical protein
MLPFFKPPVKYACHNILAVFFSLENSGGLWWTIVLQRGKNSKS